MRISFGLIVISFWLIVFVTWTLGIVKARSQVQDGRTSQRYAFVIGVAFQVVTILFVWKYLRHFLAGGGDLGWALFDHYLFNPTHFITSEIPVGPLLGNAENAGISARGYFVTYYLWNILVLDFIVGTFFWYFATLCAVKLAAKIGAPNKNLEPDGSH